MGLINVKLIFTVWYQVKHSVHFE